MQRYWDYSEKERSELTREQVEAMLTVELMEKGVLKVDEPALEPIEDLVVEKETFYQVQYAGRYSTNDTFSCVFKTVAECEAFIKLNPGSSDYDYSIGSNYTHFKPGSKYAIVSVSLCREGDVVNVASRLKEIAATKAANQKLMDAFNKASGTVTEVTSGVWDDWREQREAARGHEKIRKVFEDYVATCDGNRVTAGRFLAKAYTREQIRAAADWLGVEIYDDTEVEFASA